MRRILKAQAGVEYEVVEAQHPGSRDVEAERHAGGLFSRTRAMRLDCPRDARFSTKGGVSAEVPTTLAVDDLRSYGGRRSRLSHSEAKQESAGDRSGLSDLVPSTRVPAGPGHARMDAKAAL
jgi:hypothetical protein